MTDAPAVPYTRRGVVRMATYALDVGSGQRENNQVTWSSVEPASPRAPIAPHAGALVALGRPGNHLDVARHLWRMCFGLFIATGSFVALLHVMWRVRPRQDLRGVRPRDDPPSCGSTSGSTARVCERSAGR